MLRRFMAGAAATMLVAITLGACASGGTAASGGSAAGGATTPVATQAGGGTTAAAASGNADAGKTVFDGNGCSACHTIKGQGGKVGPDLTAVGSRLSQQQIIDQLNDPKQRPAPYTQVTSGAVMPKPNLTAAQINDLSAYLVAQKG